MKSLINFFNAQKLSAFRVFVTIMVLSNLMVTPLQVPVAYADGTNCIASTSPGGTYTVTPCITAPADGATLTGAQTVSATYTTTGANPGVAKLIFYLNGEYVITDYNSPYTFTLPTNKWVDGSYVLAVSALMKDGFTSQLSSITLTFNNGVTTPPVNTNTFTPTSGTTPSAGQPFVLAAAGDGADGATNSGNVTNLIASWNPNLFLYLGDVYEKGSATEFSNWYGNSSTFYGRFRSITDPIIGNHEYEHGVAPGYFDYWDNVPSYYSYDAAGWHFIALNSNCGLLHICAPGQAEYQWLLNDLNTHTNTCTIAYFHHPVYNVGPEGYTTTMNDIWALMAQHGVDIALTGHDHDYQRWVPLDGNGNPSSTGITEFVAGGGGHGIQQFTVTDNRMAIGYDTSPYSFGALRLQLNQDGAGFQYINHQGIVLDSGAIPCSGAPADTTAPSTPANLTATTHSATQVDLSWDNSTDNVGIAGYDIYRDGNLVTSVGYVTSYSDTNLTLGASYTYQIKARDAANNTSAFSNSAPVTLPSVLFSDGFESGAFSAWALPVTNITIQQQEVYAGTHAARATSDGTAASYAAKTLSATYNDLYYSVRFKIISKSTATSAYVQRFRGGSTGGTPIAGVLISGTDKLGYRNDVLGTSLTNGPTVTHGVWHQVQTHVHIDPVTPANGQIEIWYDGVLVNALSGTANFGTTPISGIRVGDSQASDIYDEALDDVAVNTSFIDATDSQAPSTPTGLAANATAPNSINLTWNAATDNISVTGYDLYRNGAPLATLGAVTSYTDIPVSPNFTYQYHVLARDAAGNVSGPSSIATVTTPADTTPPSVTLTAPADGISVSAKVILSADAIDAVGVEDVDFLVNGTVVGTVGEGGPYIITWDSTTVPDGSVTITARAVDTSLNETTSSSRTITVNNAGGDTTPPTVPANFTATAAGSSQVNLSWNASADNVAVTGYDIYRDGALLTGVGAVTSYSDTNVVIGATYQYQVLARDAAGNVSGLTSAVSVTIPAPLFKDGFESGDLSQWTNNGLNVQQQSVLEGIYAAHGVSNGTAAIFAYKQLSTTQNDLYYSTWFKIASQGATSAYVQRFRTSTNGAILGVFISSAGKLGYRNDVSGISTTSTTTSVSPGVWHQVQTHIHIDPANSANGHIEVWYDGVQISALSKTESLGSNPIGRVQLGDSQSTDIYDTAFDEVAFDTSFIQSSGSLNTLIDSGPLGVVNSDAASFNFSATVAGATFQCSLDGAAFSACTSPQAFAGLADGAHTFAVQATDASANADPTPATRTWTVDTIAPTVTTVSPLDIAIDVPVATNVTAAFSEAMNGATITTSNFTLVLQSDVTPIPATVTYDTLSNTATLQPTTPLSYSTTYVATVKGASGVTDQAGNLLAADMVWSFTTVSPDIIVPSVTLTAPEDASTISGTVALTADATDNTAVDHVDFLVNGTVVGTAISTPYSFNWNSTTLPNGPAAISAQAVDIYTNSAASSIHNVTIDNDVTPPSAPTNLTASVVSSGQVDLSWTAAGDDVGVTGNDIYRDGTLLASVGAVTSYSDTTTDPATIYQYQVRARDAVGHVSALSLAATATTPAALFSDGFESGDLSGWSIVNGLVIQQQQVYSGVYAARATSSGSVANANKQFSTAQYELYYSTWFKIVSLDPNNSVYLQRFIKADTFSALGVFVSKTGKLGYRNDISGLSNTSGTDVSLNVWHQVKTHVHIDAAGGPGLVEVWYDGVPVAALSQAEALGNAPIARIQLGDSTTGRTYDIAFDNITVTTPADATPPSVTLTAPANGATVGGTVTLAATATDNVEVDHVDFLVNGTVVGTDSTSPYSVNWNSAAILDGVATVTARAIDTSNNSAVSAGASTTVDNTPPDTTITSSPPAVTNATSASFNFTATEANSTFACSLDGTAFSTCISPANYTGLGNGSHTFQARATDGAGNTDGTPDSRTWTVDAIPPTVTSTIPVGGTNGVSPAANITAVFSEGMNAATITNSTITIKVKQGNNPPLAAVVTYDAETRTATLNPNANLSNNITYTVTIKGGVSGVKDLAGNALTSDFSWNFTTGVLDLTPPTVTLTAPTNGTTVSGTVTLSANASDNVAVNHVDFLVNNAVVGTDTTSPYSLSWNSASVADGSATITARAMDNSSNMTTSTGATVTVNNTPVDTTITAGPSGSVNSTSASFSFTATVTGSTFACSLDGSAFSACTSPKAYSGLTNGSHTFQVRATNPSGFTDPTPASRTWTMDTVAPDTTITVGPSGSVNSTSASFSFTSTEAGSTFACSIDGGAFSSCTSPKAYSGLTGGSHTFQVRATDAVGNTDTTPASRTWTVDIVAPTGVAITAPTNGVSVTGQVTISASASDNIGVAQVSFYADGQLLGSDTSAPFSTSWNTNKVTKSTHTLYVIATDAAGNTMQSATITVTVR